jgi:hypothetical protein
MWSRSIIFLLLLAGGAAAAPLHWSAFQSPEGHFTIAAFGPPNRTVKSQSTPLGSINEQTYVWTAEKLECDLAYSDVPSLGTIAHGKILFNELERGFKKRTGEPVQNLREWGLQGNPGRAFEFHQPKTPTHIAQVGTVRAVLVGTRFYVLIVTWDRNKLPESQEEANHFFDSFQLSSDKP